jgi:hypothetical protein
VPVNGPAIGDLMDMFDFHGQRDHGDHGNDHADRHDHERAFNDRGVNDQVSRF